MLFGGGEFLMEAMDISAIREDVPEFDAAWLDFCRLFNASNAEWVYASFSDLTLMLTHGHLVKSRDTGRRSRAVDSSRYDRHSRTL